LRILVIPTTDWLGHPFPSRLHHVFEKIAERNEVHVLRFAFYPEKRLKTKLVVHEIDEFNANGLATYYFVNAQKHFKAIREIVIRNRVDAVVISNLLSGYVAAKAINNRVGGVFDLSDYFPASGAGYYFPWDSTLGKLATITLEKLLKKTLQLVRNTVTCSHALQDYVKKLGINRVSVITNGVDEFFLSQKNENRAIREKYGLNDCVTVGYLGSIEFWLNTLPLLQAIRLLTIKGHRVKLFLVGGKLRTKTTQELQKQIRDIGIAKHVVWLNNFVAYHDVPAYIAAMDICTIPFDHRHPTAYYSAPNKLWEYLALEKPVITTPIPEPIIQAGQFINVAATRQDYFEIIEDYIKDPDRYRQKACEAKQLIKDRTWTKMAQKYENLLASLA